MTPAGVSVPRVMARVASSPTALTVRRVIAKPVCQWSVGLGARDGCVRARPVRALLFPPPLVGSIARDEVTLGASEVSE